MKHLGRMSSLCVLLVAVIGMLDLPTGWAIKAVNSDTEGLAIKGYDPVVHN
ncbi:MAG: hypothetical protein SV775_12745 [Thermodesulfobacteriota bacterium]|nr:hypothetical protein [Thermodesulfobacteriota bacterium]